MTDTPGWASPSSPEPPREDAGPSAAAPPAPAPGPYDGAYGQGHGQQYGYGPGPGGGPGWGRSGWGPPPSPKPGVIPLRPLGVGEILDGAFSTVRQYWRTALGLSLALAATTQVLFTGAQAWQYAQPSSVLPLILLAVAFLITPVVGIIATGLLTMVVSKAILGQPTTIGEAWTAARPQLLKLVGLTLLTGLILFGIGAVAFVPFTVMLIAEADPALIVLGVLLLLGGGAVVYWLYVQLSLAAPALMLEKQGVITALSRSRRLVKGAWWRTFGITLLSQIVIGFIGGVLLAPFFVLAIVVTAVIGIGDEGPSGGGMVVMLLLIAVGSIVASTVTIPLQSAVSVLLYVDRRIRREGLDIELARAAGIPGHAPPAPSQYAAQGN